MWFFHDPTPRSTRTARRVIVSCFWRAFQSKGAARAVVHLSDFLPSAGAGRGAQPKGNIRSSKNARTAAAKAAAAKPSGGPSCRADGDGCDGGGGEHALGSKEAATAATPAAGQGTRGEGTGVAGATAGGRESGPLGAPKTGRERRGHREVRTEHGVRVIGSHRSERGDPTQTQ